MTIPKLTANRDDIRSTIVEAAAQLLRDEGAHAVTTRAVAQAAGVQAPTIYRLFGDKDGLIAAVAEHVMESYVAQTAAAARTDNDPVTELRAAWRMHVEFGVANPDLYLLMTSTRTPSPATTAGIRVLAARVRRIAAAGLLRVEEQRAVQMIHAAGTGVVLATLGEPSGERDSGLSEAMFDAVAGVILASTPATPDTSAAAVAVTFRTIVPILSALTAAERVMLAEWVDRSLTALRPGSTDPSPDRLS